MDAPAPSPKTAAATSPAWVLAGGCRGVAWIVVGALLLCFASSARAQNGLAIVLIAPDPGTSDLSAKLRAELESRGYGVDELAEGESSESSREESALGVHARAVLHLTAAPSGVEVRLLPLSPGSTDFRGVVLSGSGSAEDARVVALRAVELLHAGLLQAELPEAPPPNRTAAKPPPRPTPRQHTSTSSATGPWELSIAPAVVWSPAATPTIGGAFGASWRATQSLAASGFATGSLIPARFTDGANRTDISQLIVGVGGDWIHRVGRCELGIGGGAGFVWLHATGEAAPPLQGRVREALVALSYIESGMRYELTHTLSLALDLRAGFAVPRPVLRFDGASVADWGRPVLWGTVGPMVSL